MSLGNQFQITLPSNVKGHKQNTTGQYETTLATPLDLPGEWEVALIDITYPHTWINLNKEYHLAVLTTFPDNEEQFRSHMHPQNKYDFAFIHGLEHIQSGTNSNLVEDGDVLNYFLKHTIKIIPGQYDINSLMNTIGSEIRNVQHGLNWANVNFNQDRNRVNISHVNRPSMLASFKSNSILRLLGFSKNIVSNVSYNGVHGPYHLEDGEDEIDCLFLDRNIRTEAFQAPLMTPITSIFVYTDFIEFVLVGNTQAPLLGYFPLQSTWGNTAYWNFNPAYYVKVKEPYIRSISLKLCDELGEVINFDTGVVICRLHFRRVR